MKNDMLMSIGADAFAEVRWSFDRILNTVLKKMKIRDSDQAAITLAVDIKLENVRTANTETGEILNVKNPRITYKVSHKLTYKNEDSESGEIQQADSFLVCGKDGQWMIRQIEDGQMEMQDYVQQGGRE